VEGIVYQVLDATQNWDKPITDARLFGWHAALFPTGFSGLYPINAGQWRDDANGFMQVVSGVYGRGKVNFIGPAGRWKNAMAYALAKSPNISGES
jgi:hypothetical protein